ncbi:MAG: sensor histidine kinase [Clostridia bacterium]|nr:sensor histidine kinase [Clostridia bacterium]
MPFKRPEFEKVADNIIKYVQYALIIVLVITVGLAIADAAGSYMDYDIAPKIAIIVSVCLCGVALVILESISMYLVRAFKIKMVFFSFECLTMVILGILTGSVLVVILFCTVLTECYMNLEKFVDKFIMLVCSCAFYIISYVIGWVLINAGASVMDSVVNIFSGCLYGIIALVIDFIIVEILMYFYRKNVELRHALKEAEDSKAALREAYAKLAETSVYEERNRIARDIHDNAGHSMTAVIMQTEAAKVNMDTDPELAKRSIIAANMQAKNALEQMRASVHLLAGRTDDLALKTDIEQIIMETASGTDIKIRSDLDDIAVPESVFRYVSNTVKECLSNGLRHGGATAFYVEMKQEGSALHLLISDNGSGIPGDIQEGYGLKGIRERAAELGGKCTFTTEEDDGFETDIILPLPAAPAAPAASFHADSQPMSPAAAASPAASSEASPAAPSAVYSDAGTPAVSAAVPEASTDVFASSDSAAMAATETLDATYVASEAIEEE